MAVMNVHLVVHFIGCLRNLRLLIQKSRTNLSWQSVFLPVLRFAKLIINCEVKSDNVSIIDINFANIKIWSVSV